MIHPLSLAGGRGLFLALLPLVFNTTQSIAQPTAPAAPTADKPVVASLVADKASVAPGTTVTLGVLFKMAPDWHIYWRNPGETGFATEVQWDSPSAPLATAETVYPAPITFTSPGDLVSYGYEKEVLLMTDVPVPADASGQIKFTAKPKWLMCADRCIPGRDTLSLTLPVGADQPANAELFNRYRAQLPKSVEPGTFPTGVKGEVSDSAGALQARLTVDPAPGKIVGEDRHEAGLHRLYFFPYLADKKSGTVLGTPEVPAPDSAVSTPAGQVKVYSRPVTITAQAEGGDSSKEVPAAVTGVLVVQRLSSDGKPQKAEQFDLTLRK